MENQNQGENPKLSTEKIADIARGLDKKQFKAEDIVNAYVEMDGGLFSGVDVDKLKKTVGGRIGEDINKKKGEHLFRRCKNKKGGNMRGVFTLVRRVQPPTPVPPSDPSGGNGGHKQQPIIVVPPPPIPPSPLYIGKSGEYSVMSELLLRGFNANSMTVDDGLDIVASKDNVIYYYQVKTTRLGLNGRALLPVIKRRSYEKYVQSNTRYVACVLVKGRFGCDERIYVVFNNDDIDRFKHNQTVKDDGNKIRIKLRFENDRIYAYDEKEEDVTYYRNHF